MKDTFEHIVKEENEELDRLCWRYYKSIKRMKDVLKLNPKVAENGEYLKVGSKVIMPVIRHEQERRDEERSEEAILVDIWE